MTAAIALLLLMASTTACVCNSRGIENHPARPASPPPRAPITAPAVLVQASTTAPQAMSKCEEHFPSLESIFAKHFNDYITRYHQLTFSLRHSPAQDAAASQVDSEYHVMHESGCF